MKTKTDREAREELAEMIRPRIPAVIARLAKIATESTSTSLRKQATATLRRHGIRLPDASPSITDGRQQPR